jgi:hypothetical protein
LEPETFNFLSDIIKSSVCITSIGHDAVIIVEVDEAISVLHDGCVVLCEELCWDVFQVVSHDTSILYLPPNYNKSQINIKYSVTLLKSQTK